MFFVHHRINRVLVRRVVVALGISVALVSSTAAQGQPDRGTIAGTVLDPVGAAAAKVVVQARSADGQTVRRATSEGIKWTNPHAHIAVDVKDQAGNVTSWDFEMGSPNALMRRGWSRSSLKPGDVITVSGYLAKDGSHLANARSVTLGDGRKVFAGSSIDTEATQ